MLFPRSARSSHSLTRSRTAGTDPLRKFGLSDHEVAFVSLTSALGFLRQTSAGF